MWTQARGFNQNAATKIKNLCLGNVQSGFGIPGKYACAWDAWTHTQQHADPIPNGLDIPVFFAYTATIDGINKNWGHIGVRLANGTFWSDGNIYPSIQAYQANHSPRYVGWGESVNDVRVINNSTPSATPSGGGNNMFQNDQEIIEAYQMLRGVNPSAGEIASWRGQPKQRFFQVGKAEADSIRKQLADVKAALANEQAKPPKEVVKTVTQIVEKPIVTTVIDPTATAQIAETNKIVKWIQDVISSVFNRSK